MPKTKTKIKSAHLGSKASLSPTAVRLRVGGLATALGREGRPHGWGGAPVFPVICIDMEGRCVFCVGFGVVLVDGWFGGPAFFFEGLCCLSCFAAMSPDRSMRPLFGGSGGDPGLCPQPPIGMGFLSQTGLLL